MPGISIACRSCAPHFRKHFRDPLEILHSHAFGTGRQALPGAIEDPCILGLAFEDIARLRADEWCARVLALICASALKYRDDPQTVFVDYADLPDAVFGPIARHFSLALNDAALANMRERTHFHSKDDSPWPQPEHTPLDATRAEKLSHLSATILAPLYAELRSAAAGSRLISR